ncbi:Uncharacterised protein [Mycobacteroides abscessus subsp. abscessus]|nr:Uncharacterised protein [Mycobacteroides abscessus subsp. abscessus]
MNVVHLVIVMLYYMTLTQAHNMFHYTMCLTKKQRLKCVIHHCLKPQ